MQIEASEIYRFMPQRYPMLLVDRVVHVEPGISVNAQKAISLNDHFYRDIPVNPRREDFAYPNGLLIEALAQTAGILLREVWPHLRSDKHMVMFGSFSEVKVRGRAYPGDLLDLQAYLDVAGEDAAVMSGSVSSNGVVLMEVARISAALRSASIFDGGLM